jgi:hypothetical protein
LKYLCKYHIYCVNYPTKKKTAPVCCFYLAHKVQVKVLKLKCFDSKNTELDSTIQTKQNKALFPKIYWYCIPQGFPTVPVLGKKSFAQICVKGTGTDFSATGTLVLQTRHCFF